MVLLVTRLLFVQRLVWPAAVAMSAEQLRMCIGYLTRSSLRMSGWVEQNVLVIESETV